MPTRAGFAVFEAQIDGQQIIPSAGDLALPPSTGTGLLQIVDATGQQLIAGSLADLSSGNTYFNIHTDYINRGELRGQILPVIPEPSTRVLLAAALIGSMAGGFFRSKIDGKFASTPLSK